ncbi:hypothetical protein PIB30_048244 [Stylosanthes scabra]|uniref:Uncharacterized protein n=1 Tax=Stylosanthes scabra TaxID=79078 RepID=A0ABU6WFE8_9FABA|nr:hypothetical protein [Stylosanthes scabra]
MRTINRYIEEQQIATLNNNSSYRSLIGDIPVTTVVAVSAVSYASGKIEVEIINNDNRRYGLPTRFLPQALELCSRLDQFRHAQLKLNQREMPMYSGAEDDSRPLQSSKSWGQGQFRLNITRYKTN